MTAKIFLYLGLLASVIVGLGEWCLHFVPEGPSGEISMLETVPLSRASIGHFLVVFGAPLYFAGYYGLRKLFKTTDIRMANALMVAGILAFSIGGVWVSSRYFAAVVLQRSLDGANFQYYLEQYESHYQVLVWVLRVLVLVISGLFIYLSLKNKLGIPRYVAFFNPLLLLIFSFSLLIWLKPVGVHLAPIAMNTAHFIMFAALLYFTKNKSISINENN